MSSLNHEHWMRQAIRQAQAGIAAGQSPFGAVIVRNELLVGAGHNEVWMRGDPTAHAEVVAIQRATRDLASIDLSGCVIYTTCEPCPMCATAIHWARFDAAICGATIGDAAAAGFNELLMPAAELYRIGRSRVRLTPDVLRSECAALFVAWQHARLGRTY